MQTNSNSASWEKIEANLKDVRKQLAAIKAGTRYKAGVRIGYKELTNKQRSDADFDLLQYPEHTEAQAVEYALMRIDWLSAESDLYDEVLRRLFNPKQFNVQQVLDSQFVLVQCELDKSLTVIRDSRLPEAPHKCSIGSSFRPVNAFS